MNSINNVPINRKTKSLNLNNNPKIITRTTKSENCYSKKDSLKEKK